MYSIHLNASRFSKCKSELDKVIFLRIMYYGYLNKDVNLKPKHDITKNITIVNEIEAIR